MTESNPIELFSLWYEEMLKIPCKEPTAMVLATCSKDLKPSARVVLLKQYNGQGFVFFTNINSRKGQEIQSNPYVALVFDWRHISKQVRIEGKIEMLPDEDTDKYYASRSRGSQIGAWCSDQSGVLMSRKSFIDSIENMTKEFYGKPIPRPSYWVGMKVVPMLMEFWQEGSHRIHTRYQYTRKDIEHRWDVLELYP